MNQAGETDRFMERKWFAFQKTSPDSEYLAMAFPHSGAGPSSFAAWGKTFLAGGMDFYPVQYPMREARMREKPYTDLKQLVREFAEDNLALLSSRPLILYGKCLGSLVAWELAAHLEQVHGIKTALIVSSGGVTPEDMVIEKPADGISEEDFDLLLAKHDFVTQEQLGNADFRQFFLPVLRADYVMQASCAGDTRLRPGQKLLAIYGSADAKVSRSAMQKWSKYSDEVIIHAFRGGHFFEDRTNLPEICRMIREAAGSRKG